MISVVRNPLPSAVGCPCTGQSLCSTYSQPRSPSWVYIFTFGAQKNVVAIEAFATSSNATKSPAALASTNVAPPSNARRASASALINRNAPPSSPRARILLCLLDARSLTACGTTCVNTLNDSRNCGRCVRLPSLPFSNRSSSLMRAPASLGQLVQL